MEKVRINYVAVVAAALLNMILGAIWFGAIFGDQWMSYIGKTKDELMAGGPGPYIVSGITSLLVAWSLAMLLPKLGAKNAMDGMRMSFLFALVFTFAPGAVAYAYAMRPMGLLFIDHLYPVVSFTLMGGLIAQWKKSEKSISARTA